jgi:hypothetical protein
LTGAAAGEVWRMDTTSPIYDATCYGLKPNGRVPGLRRGWFSSQGWRDPARPEDALSYSQAAWDKTLLADASQGPLLIDLEPIFNGLPGAPSAAGPVAPPHEASEHICRILMRARELRPELRIATYSGQWFWPAVDRSQWWTNNAHVLNRIVFTAGLVRKGLADWVGFEAYMVPRFSGPKNTFDVAESWRCLKLFIENAGPVLRHYVGDGIGLTPVLSPILAGLKARESRLVQPAETFRGACALATSLYPAAFVWGGVELDKAGAYLGVRPLSLDLGYFPSPLLPSAPTTKEIS